MERLKREFEAIGFYLSAHPLDAYASDLARLGVVSAAGLPDRLRSGEGTAQVKLAGTVVSKREHTSQRNNRFAFVALSDASGVYEITVFSELLARARELLESGMPVLVSGDARLEGEQLKIVAQRIEALDAAVTETTTGLRVHTGDAAALVTVQSVMERTGKGRGRVSLVLELADREVEVDLSERYAVSPATRAAIKAIAGVTDVQEV